MKLLLLGKVTGLTVQLYLKTDSTKCRLALFMNVKLTLHQFRLKCLV